MADRDDYALLVLFHNLPRCKVAWGSENMKDKRKCKKKCYKRNIYVIFIRQMDADTHRHLKFLHLVVVSPVKRERAQQTKGQWMLHVYQGCFLHETEGFVKYFFSRVWPLYIPAFHACCQSMSSLSQLCLCDLSKSKSVGEKSRQKMKKNVGFYNFSLITKEEYTAYTADRET